MRTIEPAAKRAASDATQPKRGLPTLPPRRRASPAPARTFVVHCTVCHRELEVDRAPATCPTCGGIAVAG